MFDITWKPSVASKSSTHGQREGRRQGVSELQAGATAERVGEDEVDRERGGDVAAVTVDEFEVRSGIASFQKKCGDSEENESDVAGDYRCVAATRGAGGDGARLHDNTLFLYDRLPTGVCGVGFGGCVGRD